MLRVIAYTGGRNAPSRIFRVRDYRQTLREFGIDMRECASWAGIFPPLRKWLRPAWGLWNLADRLPDTLRSYAYDLVFFQREMLSTFVTWEPLTKKPRIFDVDDAIFTHRRGDYARRLASCCDHVICGNTFLAEHFSRWNPNVSILPTSVDTNRFCPAIGTGYRERPIIGWMGLHTGFDYVYRIEEALRVVLERHPDATLRIVSSHPPNLHKVAPKQFEWIPWTPENEVRTIQEMTIGIMPLDDTILSRGKCSYKMLLYMSCGLPVVVSPVGMNTEVLERGNLGFGARTDDEWINSLSQLLANPELCAQMGRVGRDTVLKHYSVQVLAPQLAKILRDVAGR